MLSGTFRAAVRLKLAALPRANLLALDHSKRL
jgi:hypothetical protein